MVLMPNAGRKRKPVSQITDRAKRYRANVDMPAGRKLCNYCGSRRNLGVDHVDGDESHGHPDNLAWACKSCNAIKAAIQKRLGIGRRTRQYNPRKSRGRVSGQMQAYGNAIKVMRGVFPGDASAAMDTILSTPASVRSAYTAKTWATRKALYGPSGRQTEIPF